MDFEVDSLKTVQDGYIRTNVQKPTFPEFYCYSPTGPLLCLAGCICLMSTQVQATSSATLCKWQTMSQCTYRVMHPCE